MATYDPAGHPLLSLAAQALSSAELTALADLAEIELGLAGTSFINGEATQATLAVVYWINCNTAPDPGSRAVQSRSETKGSESVSVTYVDASKEAGGLALNPCARAKTLARDLVGAGSFEALRAIR